MRRLRGGGMGYAPALVLRSGEQRIVEGSAEQRVGGGLGRRRSRRRALAPCRLQCQESLDPFA